VPQTPPPRTEPPTWHHGAKGGRGPPELVSTGHFAPWSPPDLVEVKRLYRGIAFKSRPRERLCSGDCGRARDSVRAHEPEIFER